MVTQRHPRQIRTMEDFSAYVGLSRPTVSKFFNDPSSVRGSTRAKIEAALAESGFRPNLFAVNLKRRRSNILGILIPNSTDPFYMELTRSVEQLALEAGFFAFMLSSNGSHELESAAVDRLQSMNVAGLIVVPTGAEASNDRLSELERELPLVYVDSPPDHDCIFVGTDNAQSMGLMVDYLCRSGEPPCYLGMPEVNRNALDRREAYASAMHRAGQDPVLLPIPDQKTWDFERFGHEAATALIRSGLPSDTLLCANDRVALGAQLAAWEAGLKVGRGPEDDLRIAGHDDHPQARYACPPLTTVAQNYGEMARRAMTELLGRLDEEPVSAPSCTLLHAELKLRASA
ncbi:LacI family DNA-binding transcriptional regulator [Allosediminivita pacifica]|uniref:LacI family transcriptional regulator n=1 Tax=Allosediminivita pacifica TaxID=1267769 RepID=A0A2T6AG02_9RHOB|nr:LacI family DNA-binding transcriptional regulator [Allosediminivita pacifica]PTX42707.1 LacI family transcriptional regulator [Allosediminivita pacifica]GGB06290.1 LacI family transcriptional regulator [Allosediminivita pacifica]